MGRAIMFAAVSLDGYIAREDDSVGPLFDWYGNGDVPVTFSDESRVFHTTAETAEFLRSTAPRMAAGVFGRRLFDHTNGWEGVPPNGLRRPPLSGEGPVAGRRCTDAPHHSCLLSGDHVVAPHPAEEPRDRHHRARHPRRRR
jgi:dihydrofolate reductase